MIFQERRSRFGEGLSRPGNTLTAVALQVSSAEDEIRGKYSLDVWTGLHSS
jgi:hypothetical protein